MPLTHDEARKSAFPPMPPTPCGVQEVESPQRRERRDAGGEGGGAGVVNLVAAAMGEGRRVAAGELGRWRGESGEDADGNGASDPSHGRRHGDE